MAITSSSCAISVLLSVFAGWSTSIFLMPLTSLNGSKRYLFPFDGRLNDDLTVAVMTLVIFLLPAALLLAGVAAILRLLRCDRPWVYLVAGLLTPTCLMLILPPDADEIIFVGAAASFTTMGIWVLLRGEILSVYRSRLVAFGQASAATMLTTSIAFLITSHVIWARENDASNSVNTPTIGSRMMGGVATDHELLTYNWAGALVSHRLPDWQSKIVAQSGVVSVIHDPSGIWTLSLPPLPSAQRYDDPLPPGQFTVSRYQAGVFPPAPPSERHVSRGPLTTT